MRDDKRRAGGELEKGERRREILARADALFRDCSFDEIKMADLAEKVGLAKGTLYLYFPSKEALFLALLGDRLEAAFGELFGSLEESGRSGCVDADTVAARAAAVMASDPALPRLLAISHAVLEGRMPFEEAADFKRGLAQALTGAGSRLSTLLPGLSPEGGSRFLLLLYAQVVGLAGLTDLSPFMRRIGAAPGLGVFRLGFEETLRESARSLLAGALGAPGGRGEREDG